MKGLMKLRHVEIRDFRCFARTAFDFADPHSGEPLGAILLVGENGRGKSSFLHALAGFFDVVSGAAYGADRLLAEDVREGVESAGIRVMWQDLLSVTPEVVRCELDVGLSVVARGGHPGHARGDLRVDLRGLPLEPLEAWRGLVRDVAPRPTGLIVAFDVYRLLPPSRIAGPNTQRVVQHRCLRALAPTVRREGGVEGRFAQLKQWIVNIDFFRAKAKADRGQDLPTWQILRNALNTLFEPYEFVGVDERFEVLFRTPNGTVPLESLSDGFRSMFVVIIELLLRLSLATPEPETALLQEAVCLIDEVDAHLHPKWQARVIPGLRALFPNVQFIATTHSPIVVSSVEPFNVFRLSEI
jgi:energy-coupling factor transporter ATP-binding protein EcfA2